MALQAPKPVRPLAEGAWRTKPWTCFGTFETLSSITAYLNTLLKIKMLTYCKTCSVKAEDDCNKNHALTVSGMEQTCHGEKLIVSLSKSA